MVTVKTTMRRRENARRTAAPFGGIEAQFTGYRCKYAVFRSGINAHWRAGTDQSNEIRRTRPRM